jgi:4-diphosphocytidyl-2-C-methyl-D-erythritol kinase
MSDHFCPSFGTHIRMRLVKRIPTAAGLAGGSSDAAAVMLALARLWNLDAPLSALLEIGKNIGADVPFCLAANAKLNPALGFSCDEAASSCALAEGIGETLSPLPPMRGTAVLVKPNLPVSTAHVYGLWDAAGRESADGRTGAFTRTRPDTDAFVSALADNGKARAIGPDHFPAYMVNVLEPVTAEAYPRVASAIGKMKTIAAADRVFMSGSGPTVIAYFRDRVSAEAAVPRISRAFAEERDDGCRVSLVSLI